MLSRNLSGEEIIHNLEDWLDHMADPQIGDAFSQAACHMTHQIYHESVTAEHYANFFRKLKNKYRNFKFDKFIR